MAEVRQFRQNSPIVHGTTAQTNAKLTDIMPLQHEDLETQTNQMKKISLAQCLCEPYAICNSNNPANGAYVADCVNFPDFALQFTDEQGNPHSLIGLKVRVLFNYGITYGSVSGGTFPTLNINGSGAIPLLAQGKTMGAGAISAGQTVEFTIIPYGNGLAFDADSNVREANSDYTLYTDGLITYKAGNGENTISIINELVAEQIIASFNAVGNQYGKFEGTTLSYLEGYWFGYRNNTTGVGVFMTRSYLAGFYVNNNTVSKMRLIFDFSR